MPVWSAASTAGFTIGEPGNLYLGDSPTTITMARPRSARQSAINFAQ